MSGEDSGAAATGQELQLAAAAVAGLNNVVSMVQGISSNVRNIRYTPQTNTTTYYGHTNFEELKVGGNNVALASQIPDITGKANVQHVHKTDDITRDITTTIINEEEEEEITETITLNEYIRW